MKITRRELKRLVEVAVTLSDEEKDKIKKAGDDAEDRVIQQIATQAGVPKDQVEKEANKEEEDLPEALDRVIREELEKVGFYKKYSYGLDDVPDKSKAHQDIIGHT